MRCREALATCIQPVYHIFSFHLSLRDCLDGHKKCAMESLVEHLRVHVFDNGKYLKSSSFTSPKGEAVDQQLLRITQVKNGHNRNFELILITAKEQ